MQNCRRDLRRPLFGGALWISSGQHRYVSIYCEDKTLTAAGDWRAVPAASRAGVDRCHRAARIAPRTFFGFLFWSRIAIAILSTFRQFGRRCRWSQHSLSARCPRDAERRRWSEFCESWPNPHNIAPGDPSSLKLVGGGSLQFCGARVYVTGFNSCPKSGADAPEAITGDTSPHAGLAFARECAQLWNMCSHTRTSGGATGYR